MGAAWITQFAALLRPDLFRAVALLSVSFLPFLDGAKLRQPTLFIAGDRDGVLGFWGEEVEALERNVPNLRRKLILPDVGHWSSRRALRL